MFARRKCEGAFHRQVKEVCLLGRLSATVDVAEPGNKRKTNKTLGNNKVRMFSQKPNKSADIESENKELKAELHRTLIESSVLSYWEVRQLQCRRPSRSALRGFSVPSPCLRSFLAVYFSTGTTPSKLRRERQSLLTSMSARGIRWWLHLPQLRIRCTNGSRTGFPHPAQGDSFRFEAGVDEVALGIITQTRCLSTLLFQMTAHRRRGSAL
jgi:hypothetical protein